MSSSFEASLRREIACNNAKPTEIRSHGPSPPLISLPGLRKHGRKVLCDINALLYQPMPCYTTQSACAQVQGDFLTTARTRRSGLLTFGQYKGVNRFMVHGSNLFS